MDQDILLGRKEPTDHCPKCGGDLTFRSPDFAGPLIEQVASCNACGLRLADVYRFVRAEALDDDTPGKETHCHARNPDAPRGRLGCHQGRPRRRPCP